MHSKGSAVSLENSPEFLPTYKRAQILCISQARALLRPLIIREEVFLRLNFLAVWPDSLGKKVAQFFRSGQKVDKCVRFWATVKEKKSVFVLTCSQCDRIFWAKKSPNFCKSGLKVNKYDNALGNFKSCPLVAGSKVRVTPNETQKRLKVTPIGNKLPYVVTLLL